MFLYLELRAQIVQPQHTDVTQQYSGITLVPAVLAAAVGCTSVVG